MQFTHLHRCYLWRSALFGAMFMLMSKYSLQAQTLSALLSVEFGTIAASGTGTVTIPTVNNVRTKTGSISLVAGGTIRRGRIVVTGTPSTNIVITLPPSIVLIGSGGGSATLVPTSNAAIPAILSVGGTLTIRFGGTLTFAAATPTGSFSANIPVTITY
jgi:hypothetical protein